MGSSPTPSALKQSQASQNEICRCCCSLAGCGRPSPVLYLRQSVRLLRLSFLLFRLPLWLLRLPLRLLWLRPPDRPLSTTATPPETRSAAGLTSALKARRSASATSPTRTDSASCPTLCPKVR